MRVFKSTEELKVPKDIVSQVIGQDNAVNIIKKAAAQRRHVFLIGEPGTGKSLLGFALSELLPKEELVDILAFNNPDDDNQPLIRSCVAGKSKSIVEGIKNSPKGVFSFGKIFLLGIVILALVSPWFAFNYYSDLGGYVVGAIMASSFFIGSLIVVGLVAISSAVGKRGMSNVKVPKVIVNNKNKSKAPFFDGTGAHSGALLGDVLHDPFQSGGLGTPAHERVVSGMIHKAHLGVLFIDEISTLNVHSQQELLTALQEGKFSITGQSEKSAGSTVITEPVPCKFVLVAAGNAEALDKIHPALRSRITGYGYEVYMKDTMDDTDENRFKVAQFVAQEVRKDKKIPHFSRAAVDEIIVFAKRMSNRKNKLTLRFRELGGIVRSAGDIAKEMNVGLVERIHVLEAMKVSKSLEGQYADRVIENLRDYQVITNKGARVGRVNGLAVIGGGASLSGVVQPIEAEVTSGGRSREFIATGKLGDIAKESIKNVSAVVKKLFGEDLDKDDVYVQFLQSYQGIEGDSASISVATAIISAVTGVPVKQSYALTGSLSLRGEVLPVGGVSSKIQAAVEAGIKTVIIPKSNVQDITLGKDVLKKVKVIGLDRISEVLDQILDWKGNLKLRAKIKKF